MIIMNYHLSQILDQGSTWVLSYLRWLMCVMYLHYTCTEWSSNLFIQVLLTSDARFWKSLTPIPIPILIRVPTKSGIIILINSHNRNNASLLLKHTLNGAKFTEKSVRWKGKNRNVNNFSWSTLNRKGYAEKMYLVPQFKKKKVNNFLLLILYGTCILFKGYRSRSVFTFGYWLLDYFVSVVHVVLIM